MESTYQIIGSDGAQYGPIALEQLRAWIREGRVSRDTQVQRSDRQIWMTAGQFAELGFALPASPAQNASPERLEAAARLQRKIKSGAGWFHWIAALSLINSVIAAAGAGWTFIVGLGVTQFLDAFAHGIESGAATVVALGLDVLVAGVFVFFGIFAGKRHTWAFLIGMILYGLDGLLFLLVSDWLSVGFHGFALYCIFKGFQSLRELNDFEGDTR